MQCNNAFNKRKPQPTPLCAASIGAAIKLFENFRQILRRNSYARVGNFNNNKLSIFRSTDLNGIFCTSKFEGVLNQVINSQDEQVTIARNGRKWRGHFRNQ